MRYPASVLTWMLLMMPIPAQEDGAKTYKAVVPSVAWVHSTRDRGLATGSGSLIDHDRRLILTNYHVVEDNNKATVFFAAFRNGQPIPEKKYYTDHAKELGITGRVVARDKKADLALIQIETVPEKVPALTLSVPGAEPGMTVHAIGNAGKSGALFGYIPGKVRQVYHKEWQADLGERRILTFKAKVVETDSATNPGDSGGPLVNDKGELVGVTEGGAVNAQLLSTFVDVSEVKKLLASEDAKAVKGRAAKADLKPLVKRDKPVVLLDKAKLFNAETVKSAQTEIDELYAKHQLDFFVETYPTVREGDAAKVKAMKPVEQAEYMHEWLKTRAVAEQVNGVALIVCAEPKKFYLDISIAARKQFPDKFDKTLIDALTTGLKAGKPNDALTELVKLIKENRGKK